MYTRCPSCRAEICFQVPDNAANLPDGYKHKIKCPNCGVKIAVRLPNRDAIAAPQPTFMPQNPNAFPAEPVHTAPVDTAPVDEKAAKRQARAAAAANRKSGRSRNVMIFIFAALLLVCSLLGHFFADQGGATMEDIMGDIMGETGSSEELTAGDFLSALSAFDGVGMLEDIAGDQMTAEYIKAIFEENVADGLVTVLPIIFFLGTLLTAALALVIIFFLGTLLTAALALVGFIVKKYPRLLHLILALGLLAVSACILFQPFLLSNAGELELDLAQYFMETVIGDMNFLLLAPAAIGVLHTLFALIFLKSLKKKQA